MPHFSKLLVGTWWRCVRRIATYIRLPGFLSKKRMSRRIFLVGVPRCGSTWVGRILSKASGVGYVYEPFNPDYCHFFKKWEMHRAGSFSDTDTQTFVDQLYAGRIHTLFSWVYQNPLRRILARTLLIKDVNTMFSLEYLRQWNLEFVVLLRHPCAVALSMFERNLEPNLSAFMDGVCDADAQTDSSPEPHGRLASVTLANLSYMERVGLYWSCAYEEACRAIGDRDACVIRYEDLASSPQEGFKALYDSLGLGYSKRVARAIAKTCASSRESYTRRQSAETMVKWQKQLSRDQIDAVIRGVTMTSSDVWHTYYASDISPGVPVSGRRDREEAGNTCR